MIGRGVFGNPWLFAQCRAALEGREIPGQAPVPSPKGRPSRFRGACVAAAAVLLAVALVRIALPGGQVGSAADEAMESPLLVSRAV